MLEYYRDELISIYHGDAREILPTLPPVDLVLTDPPYGMQFRSNHRIIRHDYLYGDTESPIDLIARLAVLPTHAAYIFCRWNNLATMPRPRSVIVWVKNNWSMGNLKHEHGRQWEAICFYPGPEHQFITRISDVVFANRTGNDLHPTQKPLSLCKKILGANVGQVVLDPFMGSGTTLRAAKDLGRRAIGIEIEERYCEIAARRMAQAVLL